MIAVMVAHTYDGNTRYVTAFLKQTAHTAVKLHAMIFKTIRDVACDKDADLCLEQQKFNKAEASSSKELKRLPDSRPNSTCLHTTSLKFATLFMNAVGEESLPSQINTIFRCQYYISENRFKAVQHTTVSLMFKHARLAFLEDNKDLFFIKEDEWPSELQKPRCSPLFTTILDDAYQNTENDSFILQSLLDTLQQRYSTKE